MSQALSTEKYWNESVKREMKALRRERNRQAIRNFSMFLFIVGVMIGVLFALHTMPNWLPVAIEFLDSYGWMPVIES